MPSLAATVLIPLCGKLIPNTEFRTLLLLLAFIKALGALLSGSASIFHIPYYLFINIIGFIMLSISSAVLTVVCVREVLRAINLSTGVNVTDSQLHSMVSQTLQSCAILASIIGPILSTTLFPNLRDCSSVLGCMSLLIFILYLGYNVFAFNKEAEEDADERMTERTLSERASLRL